MEGCKEITHGQLFAGIGGFGLAAERAGIRNVWANEIDPFCCNVLRKNFPDIKVYEEDIKEIGKETTPSVDIISGGFPCQPFSQAGKRKGEDDERYLWGEMLRIIRELQPTYVIGENVAGLLSMENGETLKRILSDLENEGYHNEVFSIPACAIGAWHKRDRLWIISYTDNTRDRTPEYGNDRNGEETVKGRSEQSQRELSGYGKDATNSQRLGCETWRKVCSESNRKKPSDKLNNRNQARDATNTDSKRRCSRDTRWKDAENVGELSGSQGHGGGLTESRVRGMDDGIPDWVDTYWDREAEGVQRVSVGIKNRANRLKALGNAIVPQIAYILFDSIKKLKG